MSKYYSLLILSFLLSNAYAIQIQPIVGFEKVQKSTPSEHSRSRLIYGARLLVGPKILSVETEVTTGHDSETFAAQNLTIKETAYNGMLGLRSSFDLLLLNFYVRAGGHIRKRETETTTNGVMVKETPASYVSPYAGGGISIGAGPLQAIAGVTAIFIGKPASSDIEYQYTLGLGLGF
jgi:hypothetical protein